VVERLLSSPAYGERWARHWLDVAGYSDSNGFAEEDSLRPHAWRYRDYVIRAIQRGQTLERVHRGAARGETNWLERRTGHAGAVQDRSAAINQCTGSLRSRA
jgi:hypothetical protein